VKRLRPQGPSGTARGFTLLEILVVMALLSVVMLALGSAMRTIAQTQERIDQRLARADDVRVSVSFLQNALGHVSTRKRVAVRQVGASDLYFAATSSAIAWVGVMPPHYGGGGRTFFKLDIEPSGSGRALVIRFIPWEDVPEFPDWSRADFRVLARDVTSFSVRYEDDQQSPPLWTAGWDVADRLPARVSLQVQTLSGVWPFVVIPMRVLPGSFTSSGFVIGGSR
jgi:general secretion pathway protein J